MNEWIFFNIYQFFYSSTGVFPEAFFALRN